MCELGEIIEILKEKFTENPDMIVKIGFYNPHSYRGYYEDLAFEPKLNVPLEEMLAAAESAVGETYEGYKGGEYRMDEGTTCWLSEWSKADGQSISHILLAYMLNDLSIATHRIGD